MTPFTSMLVTTMTLPPIGYEVRVISVQFNRLRRTPLRALIWPVTAVSGMRCLIREADASKRCQSSICSIGMSYRYKKDEPDTYQGMKQALRRALASFPGENYKVFRRRVWEQFRYNYDPTIVKQVTH